MYKYQFSKYSILLILFFLFSCAQPQSSLPIYNEQLSINEQKIQNQLFADSWLNTYQSFVPIGIDILYKASDLCKSDDQIFGLGVDVATKFDGPESIREEINKSLSLNESLKIVAIGLDSPAARSGLRVGDEIVEINGKKAPSGEKAIYNFYEYVSKKNKSTINLKVIRSGNEENFSVSTEARCRFNYAIDLDNNTFNAYADGNNIVFSLRMAKWLLQDEIGVAIVFAHELAHNANHHVDDKIQNVNTGALVGLLLGIAIGADPADAIDLGANIGATAYSIDYENEADYLSVYILALSGYDISKAPNFWRRFAVEVPNSIYSGGGTHPSTSERYVRLETYVKEVQDQVDRGVKLTPKYKSN
tara:strand:- start:1363 stop:2445 length:1083 start_codon:yes stop_codon:yes gene_type:complete